MARILKAHDRLAVDGPAPARARHLPAEEYQASVRAQEVLEAARAEAARIREDAEADRERARRAAVEEGRREAAAGAAALLVTAAEARTRLLATAERQLVQLAMAVAEKVLQGAALEERTVRAVAARALEEARQRRVVALRVHPADAAALRRADQRGDRLAAAPIAIVEDEGVSRGGAVVETDAGSVDARLETQLALLEVALREVALREVALREAAG